MVKSLFNPNLDGSASPDHPLSEKKVFTFNRQGIFSILGILCIIFIPHTGIFPFFSYSILLTFMIWWMLKLNGEKFSYIGFSFKRFSFHAMVTGVLCAIVFFVFMQYIFFPLLHKIIYLPPPNLDDFKFIRNNAGNYIFILLMGWIIGGFYEELAFHGFIFTSLEKILGGKQAMILGFFITNTLFALYHLQLGTQGVINAFVAGCAYHALMLNSKRNMWYAFFFHGFFDTIALTYIYLGYW